MSGADKQSVYYWDSCVYLAWLMGEVSHGEECVQGITEAAKDNADRKNTIISSTILFTEVLAAKIGDENEALLRKSFRGRTHIAYDVDTAIALKAREFREKLLNHESGKKLATPDAIHLATAAIYKAHEVWSFDDGQKDRKCLGLLELNGDSRVDGLVIRKPHGSGQSSLF